MKFIQDIWKAVKEVEHKKVVYSYLGVVFLLLLYSFTQIDLSLTLSRFSIFQTVEKSFQQIGYFNRPLSTLLFLLIIFLLFAFYLHFLRLANKKKISKKTVWTTIGIVTAVLFFSYNAFSYDLFNYIFDAKIVTYYNQNPYVHKALDFPGDPMLSFMRWTHRTYPYGPIWLVLTVPLSILGFQFFLPTDLLFKSLMTISFLGSAFFIGRIVKKIKPEQELFSVVFFALNPLIFIESLVSAHNDIVMICLSLWSLYMLVQYKYIRAFILFLLSVGIKFATAFLLPALAIILILQEKKKHIDWNMISIFIIVSMTLGVVIASYRTTFQPWYLLYILPYASFVAKKYFVLIPTVLISLFGLLQYAPFLYLGNWDPPVPSLLFQLLALSVIVSICVVFVLFMKYSWVKKV